MSKKEPPKNPRRAAKWSNNKKTLDAFCTECKTWYNSSIPAQVNKHSH